MTTEAPARSALERLSDHRADLGWWIPRMLLHGTALGSRNPLPPVARAFDGLGVAIVSAMFIRRSVSELAAEYPLIGPWTEATGAEVDFGVLGTALKDALGVDYPSDPSCAVPGLVEVARAGRNLRVARDVAYGPSPHQRLDVWRSPELAGDASAPVFIHIPGGAWILGNRRGQGHPVMANLAAEGWVCVTADYRTSPRHRWPAHINDVKRVIAWTRQNIAQYGGDPEFVAGGGGSAGAHLISLAGLRPTDDNGVADPTADLSLQAVVACYGRFDMVAREGRGRAEFMKYVERVVMGRRQIDHPEMFLKASPIHQVGPDAPPFFVIHGSRDTVIPVEQARDFARAMASVSRQPVAYAELPGAQHGFDILGTTRAAAVAGAVVAFLAEVRARHAAVAREG